MGGCSSTKRLEMEAKMQQTDARDLQAANESLEARLAAAEQDWQNFHDTMKREHRAVEKELWGILSELGMFEGGSEEQQSDLDARLKDVRSKKEASKEAENLKGAHAAQLEEEKVLAKLDRLNKARGVSRVLLRLEELERLMENNGEKAKAGTPLRTCEGNFEECLAVAKELRGILSDLGMLEGGSEEQQTALHGRFEEVRARKQVFKEEENFEGARMAKLEEEEILARLDRWKKAHEISRVLVHLEELMNGMWNCKEKTEMKELQEIYQRRLEDQQKCHDKMMWDKLAMIEARDKMLEVTIARWEEGSQQVILIKALQAWRQIGKNVGVDTRLLMRGSEAGPNGGGTLRDAGQSIARRPPQAPKDEEEKEQQAFRDRTMRKKPAMTGARDRMIEVTIAKWERGSQQDMLLKAMQKWRQISKKVSVDTGLFMSACEVSPNGGTLRYAGQSTACCTPEAPKDEEEKGQQVFHDKMMRRKLAMTKACDKVIEVVVAKWERGWQQVMLVRAMQEWRQISKKMSVVTGRPVDSDTKHQNKAVQPGTVNVKESKDYVEAHQILQSLEAVLQTIIKEKPEDPYEYMARLFTSGHKVMNDVAEASAQMVTSAVTFLNNCLKENQGVYWRNIHYDAEGKQTLDVYEEPVDGTLDTEDAGSKRKPKGLVFGERVLVEGTQTKGSTTWLHVKGLSAEGWVIGACPGRINCVDVAEYRACSGRIPEAAWHGQEFPCHGICTEGYPGAAKACLVSASGDNLWRELNAELLFRDIGAATVSEQQLGGSAHFTDWAVLYARQRAIYAHLGAKDPKDLKVTVKSTADYTAYPKWGPDPTEVRDDIGTTQYHACQWLRRILPKKGLQWEAVEFLTTFQFMQTYCKWSEEDCKEIAVDKAENILRKEAFATLDASEMDCQWKAVKGSLNEAFKEDLPQEMKDLLNESELTKDKVRTHLEKLRDNNKDVGNHAAEACMQMGTTDEAVSKSRPNDNNTAVQVAVTRVLGGLEHTDLILPLLGRRAKGGNSDLRENMNEAFMPMGNDAVATLGNCLKSSNEQVRYAAADAMVMIGKDAVPALKASLTDSNKAVQVAAARALGGLGHAELALPLLARRIQDSNEDVSNDAAKAFAHMARRVRYVAANAMFKIGKDAVPALKEGLRESSNIVQVAAARASGGPGHTDLALQLLSKRMKDGDWDVRSSAAEALVQMGTTAVATLISCCQDEDSSVRAKAAECLGDIGSTEAVPALQECLQDNDTGVRQQAAIALDKLVCAGAVPALRQTLEAEAWQVREKAGNSLSEIGRPEAVVTLQEHLKDEYSVVRREAAESLFSIGRTEAGPALHECFKDDCWEVQTAPTEALGNLGRADLTLPLVVEKMKDKVCDVRRAAAEALGTLGRVEAVPALQECLKDNDWTVRQKAAESLGKIRSTEAVPALQESLKDEYSFVRKEAATSLGNIGSTEAGPALQEHLKDKFPDVREKAAESLGKIGSSEAVAALQECLKDDVGFVRWKATESLLKIGSPSAVPALQELLKDSTPWVRQKAQEAVDRTHGGHL